jgi:hypothetical protein
MNICKIAKPQADYHELNVALLTVICKDGGRYGKQEQHGWIRTAQIM